MAAAAGAGAGKEAAVKKEAKALPPADAAVSVSVSPPPPPPRSALPLTGAAVVRNPFVLAVGDSTKPRVTFTVKFGCGPAQQKSIMVIMPPSTTVSSLRSHLSEAGHGIVGRLIAKGRIFDGQHDGKTIGELGFENDMTVFAIPRTDIMPTGEKMLVYIDTLFGCVTLTVKSTTTIQALKELLVAEIGTMTTGFLIVNPNGPLLDLKQTLGDCDIQHGARLVAQPLFPGCPSAATEGDMAVSPEAKIKAMADKLLDAHKLTIRVSVNRSAVRAAVVIYKWMTHAQVIEAICTELGLRKPISEWTLYAKDNMRLNRDDANAFCDGDAASLLHVACF